MSALPRLALPLACLALAGCGHKDSPSKDLPDGGPTGTAPTFPAEPSTTPPKESLPEGAAVSDAVWARRVNTLCTGATAAVDELFSSPKGPDDPIGALEHLAHSYRADVERFARTSPPADERELHFGVVANGRESADRLDAAVAVARQGDDDDASGVAKDLGGLLPQLPKAVLATTPACQNPTIPTGASGATG